MSPGWTRVSFVEWVSFREATGLWVKKSLCLSYSLSCVVWGPESYTRQPVEGNREGGGGGLEELVCSRESEDSALSVALQAQWGYVYSG